MKYSFSVLFMLGGCDLSSYLESEPEVDTTAAETSLSDGQLPQAAQEYEKLLAIDPTNIDAATGASYLAMLRSDYAAADAYLKVVQEGAEAPIPEISMRRALIAQRNQDLDSAKGFALESGLDAGKLLAAEIMIVDGGLDSAVETLKSVSGSGFKPIAEEYVQLLDSEDDWLVALAEIQAQWAIGEREFAVEDAPSVLQKVTSDSYSKIDEIRLTWATRALSLKKTEEAKLMMDTPFESLIAEQRWRIGGIKTMIECLNSNESCVSMFTALEETAPPEGYADMRITTALLLVDDNPALSRQLVDGFSSGSAALVLDKLGASEEAKAAAEGSPIISSYLEEK